MRWLVAALLVLSAAGCHEPQGAPPPPQRLTPPRGYTPPAPAPKVEFPQLGSAHATEPVNCGELDGDSITFSMTRSIFGAGTTTVRLAENRDGGVLAYQRGSQDHVRRVSLTPAEVDSFWRALVPADIWAGFPNRSFESGSDQASLRLCARHQEKTVEAGGAAASRALDAVWTRVIAQSQVKRAMALEPTP